MTIVVIGGNGLIGSRLLTQLRQRGHAAVGADLKAGNDPSAKRVDALTGEGLPEALQGARVVVDLSNAPAWQYEVPAAWHDAAALDFFRTSSRRILDAAGAAGVKHHIALSIVGADRLPEIGYYRAKAAQEDTIRSARIPHTIVRSTEAFEFIGRIAHAHTEGHNVRVPPVSARPVAADDVAAVLAEIAERPPANATIELGGPETLRLDALTLRVLRAQHDAHDVLGDADARYFGAKLSDDSLIPGEGSRFAPTRLQEWLDATTHHQTRTEEQQWLTSA